MKSAVSKKMENLNFPLPNYYPEFVSVGFLFVLTGITIAIGPSWSSTLRNNNRVQIAAIYVFSSTSMQNEDYVGILTL